jgi:hypothetical protein
LAIVLDLRGFTSRHGRRSVDMTWWLFGTGDDQAKERRVQWQMRLERAVGSSFALVGALVIFGSVFQ